MATYGLHFTGAELVANTKAYLTRYVTLDISPLNTIRRSLWRPRVIHGKFWALDNIRIGAKYMAICEGLCFAHSEVLAISYGPWAFADKPFNRTWGT
jgi:hypothetical protein